MKIYACLLAICLCLGASSAIGTGTEATCPNRGPETKTIAAVYQGSEFLEGSGGGCFSGFKPDAGDVLYFFDPFSCDGDNIFGDAGKRVSVTYEVSQEWVYRSNSCVNREIIKSGHILTD
jgi:hypothetical protein